jgi:hypothetical protein
MSQIAREFFLSFLFLTRSLRSFVQSTQPRLTNWFLILDSPALRDVESTIQLVGSTRMQRLPYNSGFLCMVNQLRSYRQGVKAGVV